jgi:hypothetical protein
MDTEWLQREFRSVPLAVVPVPVAFAAESIPDEHIALIIVVFLIDPFAAFTICITRFLVFLLFHSDLQTTKAGFAFRSAGPYNKQDPAERYVWLFSWVSMWRYNQLSERLTAEDTPMPSAARRSELLNCVPLYVIVLSTITRFPAAFTLKDYA